MFDQLPTCFSCSCYRISSPSPPKCIFKKEFWTSLARNANLLNISGVYIYYNTQNKEKFILKAVETAIPRISANSGHYTAEWTQKVIQVFNKKSSQSSCIAYKKARAYTGKTNKKIKKKILWKSFLHYQSFHSLSQVWSVVSEIKTITN